MLSFIEKLKIQKKLSTKLSELKSSAIGFADKLLLQKECVQLLKQLGTADNDSVKPIIEKYMAGGFNTSSSSEFKKVLNEVFSLGMPVNDVGQGIINWFKANPDMLVA
ncbi:TPA: hypothetical protein ACX6RX_003231 [Photobacterium damselae]